MRTIHAFALFMLILPLGCNSSGDPQNSASGSTGTATEANANYQLVKLNLPGMT